MRPAAIYLMSLALFLFSFKYAEAQNVDDIFARTAGSPELYEHYGYDNTEAEFTLDSTVILEQASAPTRSQVDSQIRSQMRYMLGLMRSSETQAAALYPKWDFNITETKKEGANKWVVKYRLNTKGVFALNTHQYTFTLPYNPKKIFTQARNLCHDSKGVADSNFWYHWDPSKAGCPLKEDQEYFKLTVPLKIIPNTTMTFPEYAKLVDGDRNIKMTMLFGFANYGNASWAPEGNQDWGIISYNKQRNFLKSLGFTETVWTQDQIKTIFTARDQFVPHVVEMNLSGAQANVRIRLVLSDTGLYHNSRAFHIFLREALANESIVVYSGHSGIGKNLDLEAIERLRGFKFRFNPNYQILFLGSCVPYAYYTDMLFSRKKTAADPNGTLNLDIFSYAKESYFASEEDNYLTRAIVRWAREGYKTSYQEIIRSSPKYFFAINGDEDNSTTR
ncbi:hypothetical protein [Pseudobdellovibrio exovorus]|uniref:Gingipain domain-containing protein n=1 Tax=Pseudobdellovibrio exovorus JSS TaxID=1184267 RepID=M4V7U8_9BACT|nr:hypothetical protein [Pseudobdellovibrio exovorus]AGH95462.1 hypothetical protein A11Q_1246 [Pseudobdellovibrio exovorus JSS]